MQVLCASDSKTKIKSYILYLYVNHMFFWSLQPFVQDEATMASNIWHEKLWLKIACVNISNQDVKISSTVHGT